MKQSKVDKEPNLISKLDGTLWCSSHNPEMPMVGLWDKSKSYYFRQVKKVARKWWQLWLPEYEYTGTIYEGGDPIGSGFEVIK